MLFSQLCLDISHSFKEGYIQKSKLGPLPTWVDKFIVNK